MINTFPINARANIGTKLTEKELLGHFPLRTKLPDFWKGQALMLKPKKAGDFWKADLRKNGDLPEETMPRVPLLWLGIKM